MLRVAFVNWRIKILYFNLKTNMFLWHIYLQVKELNLSIINFQILDLLSHTIFPFKVRYCIVRTCSDPQPKHLSVVSSVRQVMWEIPSSAWGWYGPNDTLWGQPRCLVVYMERKIKVKTTEGITELVKVYIYFKCK